MGWDIPTEKTVGRLIPQIQKFAFLPKIIFDNYLQKKKLKKTRPSTFTWKTNN